ncbi:MAG: hypothetical protein IJS04_09555 [Muribaculaceae bacterium]|nr:hypothetical protein [Muribaculaceae bacterium]MBQ7206067.1 hypothetical protein [Muribaculaceae bacterium]
MKKLLLIAAMAAVALGASAGYNLEKVWEYTTLEDIVPGNCRQGLGMNGKFYINDRTTSTIYIYDQTGQIGTMTGSPNCTISRDEAGNIIYSNVTFPNNWGLGATITVVNPLTEETKVYQIPEECGELGRCDVLGIAKGNMMENGELYIASNTSGTAIAKLVITDGEVNTDESYNPDCGNVTTSTTTPIYYFKDLAGNDALLYNTRNASPVKLYPDPENPDNYIATGFNLPERGTAMGLQPFVWDGKELYLYNRKRQNIDVDYLDGFAVAEAYTTQANMTTPIVTVLPTVTTAANANQINWLWAEVDDDGVTIYQYYPGTGGHLTVYRLTKTTDYTVAGTDNLFGSNWDPSDTNNDMVMGEDGIYTWAKDNVEMTAGTEIKFKVVQDHDWANAWPSQDYYYKFAEDGTYNLKITFDPETEQVKFFVNGEDPNAEMVYTVVGPEDIFGTNWNVNDTNNDMVKDEDGIYIWSKDNVALYGNFSFKVVGNHSYDIYQWPTVGNWDAHLTEGEGIYSILITFDPEAEPDFRITCTLTKTGSITPVEHTYTVAGTDNLFGSFWNPADTSNDMVKGEDGIYTWTKNGVVFDDVTSIAFKIVQDHAWTYSWPDNNYEYIVQAGAYNFVITFNADTKEITCVATPAGLRGDVNNDQKVDITDATTLINYLLYGDATGINMTNANCDWQNDVDISDATTLINFLLYGTW